MEVEREMACGRAGWRVELRVLLRLGDLEWMDAPADWGRIEDGATVPVVAVWVRAVGLTGAGDSASSIEEGDVGVMGVVSSIGSAAGVSARDRRLAHSWVRNDVATFGGAGGRRDFRREGGGEGGAVSDGGISDGGISDGGISDGGISEGGVSAGASFVWSSRGE
jgi:hypothetical protein